MSQDIPEFMTPIANQKNNDRPLSPNGRFNRLSYLAWSSLLTIVMIIALCLVAFFSGLFALNGLAIYEHLQAPTSLVVGIAVVGIILLTLYFQIVVVIRRLHDVNMSGWLSLLLIVPFIQFLLSIYLIFMPGNKGTNDYGLLRPSPLWEKVLGWLNLLFILASLYTVFNFWNSLNSFNFTDDTVLLQNPTEMIQKGTSYF